MTSHPTMIHVYVSGPLTTGCFVGPGPFDLLTWEHNVRKAEELQFALELAGFAPYCPHSHNRFAFGRIPESIALEVCFAWVRRCDALALVEGWQFSSGTRQEILIAREMSMPVFGESSRLTGIARVHETVEEVREWAATRITQPIELGVGSGPGTDEGAAGPRDTGDYATEGEDKE